MPAQKLTEEFIRETCRKLSKQQFASRFSRSQINEMHCVIVGYYAPVILSTECVVNEIYKAL